MAFGINLNSSSGDIRAIIKYDARAGRIQRMDREDGVTIPTDITTNFTALFDFENAEKGWLFFAATGPDFKLVPLEPINGLWPEQPSDKHRQGVKIPLKLAGDCGGDVRDIATVAKVSLQGLNQLHDAYLAHRNAHPGQLPIVILRSTRPITTGTGVHKSTNYEPQFEITGWAPRPADLPAKTQAPANGGFKQLDAPPATGATKVGAPPAIRAPEATSDFG